MATKIKVLEDLHIDEVSLVDAPANQHAKIKLFKRASEGDKITDTDKNLFQKFLAFIKKEDAEKQTNKGKNAMSKTAEDLQKELDIEKAKTAELSVVSKMNDAEKEFLNGLSDDKKKAFLDATPEERKDMMKSSTGGEKIVDKAAASEIAKRDAKIAKLEEAQELAKFEKRAEKEYANLPGETEVKAKALRAVEAIEDKDAREFLQKNLSLTNEKHALLFKEVGKGGGQGGSSPEEKLDALAKARATKDGIPFAKAYAQILETEEGKELHNQHKAEKLEKRKK